VQWGDLAEADLGPLETLSDQWRGYVDRLEEYGNVLAEDVAKHLSEDVFEGDDAVAARARLDKFQKAVSGDVLDRAAAIRDTLAEQLDALKAELDRRETIATDAGNAGLSIAANGYVALARPEQTVMGVEETEAQQQLINDTAAAVTACVDAYALADAQLAAALNAAWEEPSTLPMPIGENPELEEIPTGPEHVAEWWAGLDEMERDAYLEAFPEVLGGLDGMPAETRDEANREVLSNQITQLDAEITSVENQLEQMKADGLDVLGSGRGQSINPEYQALLDRLDELNGQHDDAERLQGQIEEPSSSGAETYLLDFSLEGDGQAVVAIGNPDTADNAAVHVPGTYSELSNFGSQIDRADTMQNDATNRYGEGTAVNAWLGYDAPDDLSQASNTDLADAAAGDLNSFFNGLDAAHEGDSHTTMMGHSYGSTVVGDTAANYDGVADELITIASPGTTVRTADELSVGEDHVWSTTAEGDAIEPVAATPLLGYDATIESFGGTEFSSDAVGDSGTDIHGGYFGLNDQDEPNAARENIAAIITGNTGDVY
jgi:pimeloyl-ACP methyl ester carboxylesterase